LLVSAHKVQLSDIFTESGCMIVWSEKLQHTTAKTEAKVKNRFDDAK